jgi:hypothetical protein
VNRLLAKQQLGIEPNEQERAMIESEQIRREGLDSYVARQQLSPEARRATLMAGLAPNIGDGGLSLDQAQTIVDQYAPLAPGQTSQAGMTPAPDAPFAEKKRRSVEALATDPLFSGLPEDPSPAAFNKWLAENRQSFSEGELEQAKQVIEDRMASSPKFRDQIKATQRHHKLKGTDEIFHLLEHGARANTAAALVGLVGKRRAWEFRNTKPLRPGGPPVPGLMDGLGGQHFWDAGY